ncbi:MAG: LysM peptidoglycan-binding domain-containing protein [Bacteroidaceae bacterium]|nr:LysM peptidoglycan-binding domain-containing protein [Bacteroidaceae bacterium]
MKFIKHISLALLLMGSSITGWAQVPQSDNSFSHTVLRGQTLYSISTMYGVSIDDIVALNPGTDKQLRAGETIRIPQQKIASDGTVETRLHFHTIQAGETLYRITQMYQVGADVICKANPGLSAQNFRTGQVIVIPITENTVEKTDAPSEVELATESQIQPEQEIGSSPASPCREIHKVKRKETIFSISRQYGISEQELIDANPELKTESLKKGSFLCIPEKKEVVQKPVEVEHVPTNEELIAQHQPMEKNIDFIDAALVLPFQLDAANGHQPLMVEYYEGFLLAVDSLKRQGVNINLHVFDTGDRNASVDELLTKPELKQMDVIFGPGHAEHVNAFSNFAKENGIRLVVPFTSKDSDVFTNPYLYQINTPQSYLYAQVYKLFADQFSHYNIIFVDAADGNDKDEYIRGLKQELDTRAISYQTIAMPEVVEVEEEDSKEPVITVPILTEALDSTKQNILIPTSGANTTLVRLLPIVQLVIRTFETPYDVHLFGYPEWQKYYNDHLQAFYELDTYFYSSFYTNNLLPSSKRFHTLFRNMFNKEMRVAYPKYGMLGFDTAYYFLLGLSAHGSKLEDNLNTFDIVPVQTGFHFERVNNWGGFINKKVFFIHMTRNHELIKMEFKQ